MKARAAGGTRSKASKDAPVLVVSVQVWRWRGAVQRGILKIHLAPDAFFKASVNSSMQKSRIPWPYIRDKSLFKTRVACTRKYGAPERSVAREETLSQTTSYEGSSIVFPTTRNIETESRLGLSWRRYGWSLAQDYAVSHRYHEEVARCWWDAEEVSQRWNRVAGGSQNWQDP